MDWLGSIGDFWGGVGRTAGNAIRWGANAIDDAYGDIPFVSNPFRSSGSGGGGSSGGGGGGGGGGWGNAPTTTPTAVGDIAPTWTPAPLRLPDFDSAAAWDRARQMARDQTQGWYDRNLEEINRIANVDIRDQRTQAQRGKQDLQTTLDELMEDIGTQRGRTTEDTESAIGSLEESFDTQARQQGLEFDTANRAMSEALGEAGTAETGLGQGAQQEVQREFRDMTNDQVRQLEDTIQAQNVLMNRTFEDLATKGERGTSKTQREKKRIDVDLDRYINDRRKQREMEEYNLGIDRELKVIENARSNQQSLVDEWIRGLRDQGYTTEEVEAAANIYR